MTKISRKPLVLALALAFSPAVALASVTADQLPGDGAVYPGFGSATATVSGASMTVNLQSVATDGVSVITWGNSGGTLNPNAATGGFNIGSQASVTFDNGTGGSAPFVLNVDTTGNPTEIAGTLTGNDVNMAVANANGILVDGTATINAPEGIGLLNFNYTAGDLAAFSNGTGMILDYAGATGGVTVATGSTINASGTSFIAGAGVVNIDSTINETSNQNVNNTISIFSTDTVNINAPVSMDGYAYGSNGEYDPIRIAGQNININAPVTLNTPAGSSGAIAVSGFSPTAPSSGVLDYNLNISSTGSLIANGNGNTASSVQIYAGGYGEKGGNTAVNSLVNITDNGQISAPYGYVYIGGESYNYQNDVYGSYLSMAGTQGLPAGAVYQAVGSVSGSGSITGNQVIFNNQVGPVNNNTSGQILANGFTVDAGTSGTVEVSLVDGASQPEGINLKINGNADFNNVYQAPSVSSTNQPNPAPDAASRLIVQDSGTLVLGATFTGFNTSQVYSFTNNGSTMPVFNFPGLIYMAGGQGLTVQAAVDNAYATTTPQGYGLFLLGPTVNDTYPIIANGDRGVNLESLSYGPTVINGTNVAQGEPANLPEVYFLQNTSGGTGLVNTQTFTNEWGWQQQGQTFFAAP